jgi:predicted DNA-binding protein YlxM (UPF0122 family)
MTIAKNNSIKKGDKIIDEINDVVKRWNKYATQAEVIKNLKEKINNNLNVY